MRKILRFILRSLIGLTLLLLSLAILIPIGAYFFFDPNNFKPQISAYLSDKTGLPLTIEGPMEFTYFPWLGLKAENINVEQAPNFGKGKFIQINEMDLKIPLHDLLRKNLIIESLRVRGLNIHLVKQSNGQTNWEHYNQKLSNAKKEASPPAAFTSAAASTVKKTSSSKTITFALKHFDIKNAKVDFVDNKAKQKWAADSLSLVGQHGKKGASPVSIQLSFLLTPFDKSPTLTGKAKVQGKISFEKDKPWIDLNSALTLEMPDSELKHATIDANITGDLNKQIKATNLQIKTGPTEIKGNLTYPLDAQSAITFSLNINEFDLNPYLNKPSKPTSKVQLSATKNASQSGKLRVEANSTPERALEGTLSIGKLSIQNVTLNQVNTKVKKQGANLALKPFTANVFDGKLSANITHSLSDSAPTTLQGNISGLSLAPMLRSFDKPQKINGKANIDFNLAHSPSANVNGVIKCNVTNGIIQGIDINYYLAMAQSLLKKVTNSVPDTKQTSFDSLSATLNLHDNTIDNNDLTILSQDFKANGSGSIYLNSQNIEYKLQATKVYHDGKDHPNAFPLAIRIKGSLQNPKVEPDLDVYVKKLMNNELNQHLDKQLQKGLNKLIGNKKGDPDNPNPDAEAIIKEKLEKEVGKSIKKIFKVQ